VIFGSGGSGCVGFYGGGSIKGYKISCQSSLYSGTIRKKNLISENVK